MAPPSRSMAWAPLRGGRQAVRGTGVLLAGCVARRRPHLPAGQAPPEADSAAAHVLPAHGRRAKPKPRWNLHGPQYSACGFHRGLILLAKSLAVLTVGSAGWWEGGEAGAAGRRS